MENSYPDEYRRLQAYSQRKRIGLLSRLGWGMDGFVYSTTQRSAVKARRQIGTFDKGLRVFQKLAEHPEHAFAGFNVPKLLDFHPELLVIEVELVIAPSLWTLPEQRLESDPQHSLTYPMRISRNGKLKKSKPTVNRTGS